MSETDMKSRTATYWEARLLAGRATLQSAVAAARVARPRWSDRVTNIASTLAPDGQIFLNAVTTMHGMVFGQVVMFETGRHHQALNLTDGRESLDLVEISPSSSDERKRAEFLESIMYFGVKGNHLVIVQSQALRSRDLENYLNWLLTEAGAIDPDDDGLSFERGVKLATKAAIAKHTPSKIRIGTPLFTGKKQPDVESVSVTRKGKQRVELTGGIWSFLNKLSGKSLNEINLDNSIDPESIRVYVEVSYRRKSDEEAAKIMEDLSHSLRHLHEDDVSITLPKAGVIKGEQLYVSTPLRVQAKNGNVVEHDLYRLMSEWLRSLLENRIVGSP